MITVELSDETTNTRMCIEIAKTCIGEIYSLLRVDKMALQKALNERRNKYLNEWLSPNGSSINQEQYILREGSYTYSRSIQEISPLFDLWCDLKKIILTVSELKSDPEHPNRMAMAIFSTKDIYEVTIDIYASKYTTEAALKDAVYHEMLHAFGDREAKYQYTGKPGAVDGVIRTNFIGVEAIKSYLNSLP